MSLLYLAHLNKPERIEILVMVRYGDRQRTHVEACALFHQEHPDKLPMTRSTLSKLVGKYTETGCVRDLPIQGRP
jgi:hypothetical protein